MWVIQQILKSQKNNQGTWSTCCMIGAYVARCEIRALRALRSSKSTHLTESSTT